MGSSLRHVGSFVAALGLLSSCGLRVFSLSSCGTWAPGHVGSVVVARGLYSLWHMGSLVEVHELSSCGVWV